MSIYEKTKCARALLYWAANNNGNEAYYLEDRMYAVADNGMVIVLTADSYDEAIRKAKARQTVEQVTGKLQASERPQGEWKHNNFDEHYCNKCGSFALWAEEADGYYEVQSNFCPNCGRDMRKGGVEV